MIVNQRQNCLISFMDPADRGALWVYDLKANETAYYPLSNADSVCIVPGQQDHFAIIHQAADAPGSVQISAHSFESMAETRALCDCDDQGCDFQGKDSAWKNLPTCYRFKGHNSLDEVETMVLRLDAGRHVAVRTAFPPEETFARDTFGEIAFLTEAPGGPLLISSSNGDIYIVNPTNWKVQEKLEADEQKYARPAAWRQSSKEFLVADASRLLRLRKKMLGGWGGAGEVRLKYTDASDILIPARVLLSPSENMCAVLRPERLDAVLIDCSNFQLLRRIRWSGAPEASVLLDTGELIGRQFETGNLLSSDPNRFAS